MSGPDDTTPPSGPVTTPTLPDDPPEIIPAGKAEEVLSIALDDLAAVFLRLEALAMACARQLDATASKVTP